MVADVDDLMESPPLSPAKARTLTDHYCPSCGMFLMSTDAPSGKRIRVRCTSKGCKGRIREIIVDDPKATRRVA